MSSIWKHLQSFASDRDGAVTVDWVVLTAAIVGLNIVGLINYVNQGSEDGARKIDEKVQEARNFGM